MREVPKFSQAPYAGLEVPALAVHIHSGTIDVSHFVSNLTLIVLNGMLSWDPDSSSPRLISVRSPRPWRVYPDAESRRRRNGGNPVSRAPRPTSVLNSLSHWSLSLLDSLPLWNSREAKPNRGRNVGRHADIIPLEHSTTHHVHAVDRVPKYDDDMSDFVFLIYAK
jgi:hypothetical protein